jgi:hypothetical protein
LLTIYYCKKYYISLPLLFSERENPAVIDCAEAPGSSEETELEDSLFLLLLKIEKNLIRITKRRKER